MSSSDESAFRVLPLVPTISTNNSAAKEFLRCLTPVAKVSSPYTTKKRTARTSLAEILQSPTSVLATAASETTDGTFIASGPLAFVTQGLTSVVDSSRKSNDNNNISAASSALSSDTSYIPLASQPYPLLSTGQLSIEREPVSDTPVMSATPQPTPYLRPGAKRNQYINAPRSIDRTGITGSPKPPITSLSPIPPPPGVTPYIRPGAKRAEYLNAPLTTVERVGITGSPKSTRSAVKKVDSTDLSENVSTHSKKSSKRASKTVERNSITGSHKSAAASIKKVNSSDVLEGVSSHSKKSRSRASDSASKKSSKDPERKALKKASKSHRKHTRDKSESFSEISESFSEYTESKADSTSETIMANADQWIQNQQDDTDAYSMDSEDALGLGPAAKLHKSLRDKSSHGMQSKSSLATTASGDMLSKSAHIPLDSKLRNLGERSISAESDDASVMVETAEQAAAREKKAAEAIVTKDHATAAPEELLKDEKKKKRVKLRARDLGLTEAELKALPPDELQERIQKWKQEQKEKMQGEDSTPHAGRGRASSTDGDSPRSPRGRSRADSRRRGGFSRKNDDERDNSPPKVAAVRASSTSRIKSNEDGSVCDDTASRSRRDRSQGRRGSVASGATNTSTSRIRTKSMTGRRESKLGIALDKVRTNSDENGEKKHRRSKSISHSVQGALEGASSKKQDLIPDSPPKSKSHRKSLSLNSSSEAQHTRRKSMVDGVLNTSERHNASSPAISPGDQRRKLLEKANRELRLKGELIVSQFDPTAIDGVSDVKVKSVKAEEADTDDKRRRGKSTQRARARDDNVGDRGSSTSQSRALSRSRREEKTEDKSSSSSRSKSKGRRADEYGSDRRRSHSKAKPSRPIHMEDPPKKEEFMLSFDDEKNYSVESPVAHRTTPEPLSPVTAPPSPLIDSNSPKQSIARSFSDIASPTKHHVRRASLMFQKVKGVFGQKSRGEFLNSESPDSSPATPKRRGFVGRSVSSDFGAADAAVPSAPLALPQRGLVRAPSGELSTFASARAAFEKNSDNGRRASRRPTKPDSIAIKKLEEVGVSVEQLEALKQAGFEVTQKL
jgi:hypothetical protein